MSVVLGELVSGTHEGQIVPLRSPNSITTFRYCGDAPWTKHRIKEGDLVSLYSQSNVMDGSGRFYYLTFNMKMD